MSILSTNSRLIKVGQDYSAGSGISIDDGVISVTGEFGKTYSAGDNVDIYEQDEQLYISSKDWEQDIAEASANAYNEAVAQIPDPFDPSYLSAQIDNKLDATAFTTWQNGQYTTDLQTIEGQINNKLDTSSFSDVSGSFLTAHQSLEGYATEDWVTAQGYITGVDLSNYYTKDETSGKEELAQAFADIPVGDPEVNAYVTDNSASLNGTTDLVQNSSGLWNDVAVYQSNSANYLTAHQDISYKLDESAFADVSSTFLTAHQSLDGYATVEDVKSATSGKANWTGVVTYANKPEYDYIYANYNNLTYVNGIMGQGLTVNPNQLWLSGLLNAYSAGLESYFWAPRITADTYFSIKAVHSILTGGSNDLFFSAANTALGTAQLTTAFAGPIVHIQSPKFEARNISGAGFCIEASGARGYDHNGNVTWDTTKAPAPEQLVAGADSTKPNILLSPYMPKSMSAQFINAPLFSADGNGFYVGISGQYIRGHQGGVLSRNGELKCEIANYTGVVTGYTKINGGDVTVYHSTAFGAASGTWYLTNSVQKREIEYDEETSAITAIAGSAIGGGGVTGEFVPQSAFDELKQSYDALSSLFATYSGQWLLPNEGEE